MIWALVLFACSPSLPMECRPLPGLVLSSAEACDAQRAVLIVAQPGLVAGCIAIKIGDPA